MVGRWEQFLSLQDVAPLNSDAPDNLVLDLRSALESGNNKRHSSPPKILSATTAGGPRAAHVWSDLKASQLVDSHGIGNRPVSDSQEQPMAWQAGSTAPRVFFNHLRLFGLVDSRTEATRIRDKELNWGMVSLRSLSH